MDAFCPLIAGFWSRKQRIKRYLCLPDASYSAIGAAVYLDRRMDDAQVLRQKGPVLVR